MKKATLFTGAALVVSSMVFAPIAASATTFDCSKAAIWAYNGDDKSLRKINPFGDVVSTVTLQVPDQGGSGDVAIDSTYHHAFLVSGVDGVESYNAATGAMDSGYPKAITGPYMDDANGDSPWSSAGGVIDGGNIIVNGYDETKFYSINPNTGVSTVWADLANADAGLPAGGQTGGSWSAGADVVQAVDGSVYILASNSNYNNNLLIKVNPDNTTQMTVVGVLPDEIGSPWGLARAGDNMYATDGNGRHIYQLGAIPSSASDATLTGVDAGDFGDGTLWGLAGTNDSSPGATHCTFNVAAGSTNGLANTGGNGSDLAILGSFGFALLAGGLFLMRKASLKK